MEKKIIEEHKKLKKEMKENKEILQEDIHEFVINKPEGYCVIRLSQPLLKYRSVKELHETLLHEMIHAYLFMEDKNYHRDIGGHGENFQKFMRSINKATGYNLTIYHTFHNEIECNQDHIWLCDGVCQTKKPFFGIVKRASNRAPSK